MAHNLGPLGELPLDRFCHFVWYMLTRNGSATDIAKIRARLWRQPEGLAVTDARSPWSAENEGRALSAMKASLGGT